MNTLSSKAAQRALIAQMCAGLPVTRCAPAQRPQTFTTHTGAVFPNVEQFGERYLGELMGDRPIMPVLDDDGQWAAEGEIARKRGQDWRDEVERVESGELVGYWAASSV